MNDASVKIANAVRAVEAAYYRGEIADVEGVLQDIRLELAQALLTIGGDGFSVRSFLRACRMDTDTHEEER